MTGPTRVVHMTSAHQAGDSRIFHRECRTLAAEGFEVELIVPDCEEAVRDGVHIVPVPRAISRFDRVTRLAWRILRVARARRATIYHFHDPELLPVGVALSLLGAKVVYDVHEDYGNQVAEREWIPRRLRRPAAVAVGLAENVCVRALDGVVAVTPTIAGKFAPSKTETVQNFPPHAEFAPVSIDGYIARRPLVAYTGEISALRGAREMVAAMELVSRSDACLVMAGRFPSEALNQELRGRPGWTRVDYRGWVERPSLPALLEQCRVGLALLHPVENYLTAQPIKLFEYMAAGIPVVASDFPAWRPFVAEEGAGVLVNPLDAGAVAAAITGLLDDPVEAWEMGQRGRRAVETRLGWESQGARLVGLYHRLLAGDGERRSA